MSDEFNDPELKKAAQRAWAQESAPPRLRTRIAATVTAWPQPRWTDSISWQAFAGLAAIVLLGTTIMFSNLWTNSQAPRVYLPAEVAAMIMQTHDRCCLVNDHHFVPRQFAKDMPDTGRWLSSKAHVPVVAVDMDQGWNYCGAGACRVNGITSGHLLFKRGPDDLSIFSLPAAQFGLPAKNEDFAIDTYKNHTYAAFVKNGALYCVMARDPSGQFGPPQVEAVRQSLMRDFPNNAFAANGSAPPPSDLALLLEDGND